jgi:hypothetical protein
MRSWTIAALAWLATACTSGATCPSYMFDCGGVCFDVMGDDHNCGACGHACPSGQVCSAGACVVECPEGYEMCSGTCRDVTSDQYNCGACGSACLAGFVCLEGSCTPDCPDGYEECSGTCRNTTNDPGHCGECFHACAPGEVCSSGSCSFTCPAPYVDCSGSCADTSLDHENCGSCGHACGAGEVCADGTCTTSCFAGLTMCSGVCVDLMRDPANCGSCAHPCETGEFCYDGACTAACPGGFTDCSGTCRDLMNDRLNCGACDSECAGGEVCDAGTCAPTCAAPLVACSGACTDTSYDPDNCGSCGTACASDEACVAGSCESVTILWDPSLFPISVSGTSGGWSDIDIDSWGNLVVAGQYSGDVFAVSRVDGSVTTIATDVGGSVYTLCSITFDHTRGMIYTGTNNGNIVSVDPLTGSSVLLGNYGTAGISSMAMAPTGFGSYGDEIIATTSGGVVMAIDPASPTTSTTIATGLSTLAGIAFASDGTCYVVQNGLDNVVTLTATGTTAVFATGFGAPDGIAIDDGGSRMFIADSDRDELYEVAIPGGTSVSLGSYDFDSGWYISGLAWDGVMTLIMATGESSLTLRAITP